MSVPVGSEGDITEPSALRSVRNVLQLSTSATGSCGSYRHAPARCSRTHARRRWWEAAMPHRLAARFLSCCGPGRPVRANRSPRGPTLRTGQDYDGYATRIPCHRLRWGSVRRLRCPSGSPNITSSGLGSGRKRAALQHLVRPGGLGRRSSAVGDMPSSTPTHADSGRFTCRSRSMGSKVRTNSGRRCTPPPLLGQQIRETVQHHRAGTSW